MGETTKNQWGELKNQEGFCDEIAAKLSLNFTSFTQI